MIIMMPAISPPRRRHRSAGYARDIEAARAIEIITQLRLPSPAASLPSRAICHKTDRHSTGRVMLLEARRPSHFEVRFEALLLPVIIATLFSRRGILLTNRRSGHIKVRSAVCRSRSASALIETFLLSLSCSFSRYDLSLAAGHFRFAYAEAETRMAIRRYSRMPRRRKARGHTITPYRDAGTTSNSREYSGRSRVYECHAAGRDADCIAHSVSQSAQMTAGYQSFATCACLMRKKRFHHFTQYATTRMVMPPRAMPSRRSQQGRRVHD